ncbi:MAG: hypothetical protein K8T25_06805 [Planctomycetia bacterium]|nr:hypothetical protein [Planctomycetia bacterium]
MRARFLARGASLACALALMVFSGCSVKPEPGTIQIGMPYDAAVKAVEEAGGAPYGISNASLPPGQNLQARKLRSGKVVVLQGAATLESIEVLDNPEEPKQQKLNFVYSYSVR